MLYLFRLITSRRFYIGMLCMSLVVFGLTKLDVFSFRWTPAVNVSTSLELGTHQFIPRKHIKELAIAIVYENITIGNEWSHQYLTLGEQTIEWSDIVQATQLTQLLEGIMKTDIIDMIRRSDDKQSIIQTFLSQWDVTLRQSRIVAQRLQSTILSSNTQLVSCQNKKSQADTTYRQGLAQHNVVLIDQATQQATEANTCIADMSTKIKSLEWVLWYLVSAANKSQAYISLVRTHQYTIVTYPDLIGSETPANILQLQKDFATLQSN